MTVRKLAAAAIAAASMTTLAVSPAAALHCTDNGGPGHSDFATHAQDHGDEGAHQGWATCEAGAQNSEGKPFNP